MENGKKSLNIPSLQCHPMLVNPLMNAGSVYLFTFLNLAKAYRFGVFPQPKWCHATQPLLTWEFLMALWCLTCNIFESDKEMPKNNGWHLGTLVEATRIISDHDCCEQVLGCSELPSNRSNENHRIERTSRPPLWFFIRHYKTSFCL